MEAEILSRLWPMAVAIVALVAWAVRLESQVIYLKSELEEQKKNAGKKHDDVWSKLDGMQITMTSILQGLAKIEGKLEAQHDK